MQRRLAAHVPGIHACTVLQQQPAHVNDVIEGAPWDYCAAEYCEHEGSGTKDACAELKEMMFGRGG